MNNLDKQYIDLLQDILENGVTKTDRTGTGTLSVFGRQIRHKMSEGFPLLTTKKMPFRLIATELMWFLRGDTNIKFLVDNNCHIWDGDCFANYLKTRDRFSNKDNVKEDVVINGMNGSSNRAYTQEEFINKIKTDDEFAKKWGELGPVYGKQWRRLTHHFPKTYPEVSQYEQYIGVETIDQITNLINDLKTNPDSRRLMVNAWNLGVSNQKGLFDSVVGQIKTQEKRWIVDIDVPDYHVVYELTSFIETLKPEGPKIEAVIPTKNGYHLITGKFDVKTFKEKYPDIDIQKKNPTLLYLPKSLNF